ncbi:MAG: DUF177 domain-containing protein [Bryobacterales bacterium]|nr:DUF177 domain-containing protein [Bryobacterales bacterium]
MFVSTIDLRLRDLEFDLELKPGVLVLSDDPFIQETVLKAAGIAQYRESTREILVRGGLETTISFPCDRCLEKIFRPLKLSFDLAYLPEEATPTEEEREVGSGEIDLAFYHGEGLDLDDVLREQILLDLPMRRVCEPACAKEPLPLKVKTEVVRDPRWSVLEGFRPVGADEPEQP